MEEIGRSLAATLRGCVHPTQPEGAGREWKLFYA